MPPDTATTAVTSKTARDYRVYTADKTTGILTPVGPKDKTYKGRTPKQAITNAAGTTNGSYVAIPAAAVKVLTREANEVPQVQVKWS